MESAEQPANDLHKKVGTALEEMGHHAPTLPPNEGPVLAEDLREMIEDVSYNTKDALEEVVRGGVTHVRTTESKKPNLIARLREKLKGQSWK